MLPFKSTRGEDDERHVHPLQLDVIERCVILWSNPREVVFTPFMGVGSEVYGAVIHDRKGVGIELKDSYYRQAVNNMKEAVSETRTEQQSLFDVASSDLSDNLDETFDPPSSVGSVEADEGAEYLREERAGMGQF